MSRRTRSPMAISVAMLSLATSAHAQNAETELAEKVDAIFARFDVGTPGCVVGVIKDGKLLYGRAHGMASLEHDVPLSTRSIVNLASESKQFTAAVTILAARAGHISLDDALHDYVPELPDYARDITIRHLLYHTSGLRDYSTLWLMAGDQPGDLHTAEETLELLARQKSLNFAPGEDYAYTNSGYFLLGVVIERATGESLREFAREELFEPLGMHETRYRDDHTEIVDGRAAGHVRKAGGGFGRVVSNSEVVGPTGLLTTLEDLVLWDGIFYEDAIGGEGLGGALLEPGVLANGDTLHYGGGLVLGDFDGLATASHGGSGEGFRTFILRFPQMRFTVACLCNLSGVDAPGMSWRTAATYLFGPFVEETKRLQHNVPPPNYVELPGTRLDRWAGAYRHVKSRAIWRVNATRGGLHVQTGWGRFDLRPLSETRFQRPGRGLQVAIQFERRGSATDRRMRVEIEGEHPMTFAAVELTEPIASQLAEYTGEYYSDELGVPWEFVTRDGRLYLSGAGAPQQPFVPTIVDEFALGADLVVHFERDQRGRVTGFRAYTERVRGLRFVKRR